jgi:hypothetical protein
VLQVGNLSLNQKADPLVVEGYALRFERLMRGYAERQWWGDLECGEWIRLHAWQALPKCLQ